MSEVKEDIGDDLNIPILLGRFSSVSGVCWRASHRSWPCYHDCAAPSEGSIEPG